MTLFPRSYEPLRHPLVFSALPRELVIAPIVLQGFRPGTRRASPVASSVLVPVLSLSPRRSGQASQPCFACPCSLRPTVRDSTSGVPYFRGYHCVHFRYGPGTRSPSSTMAVSMGFSALGFPPRCHPSYRAQALTLVGLLPTEQTRLTWTHNRAYSFPIHGFPMFFLRRHAAVSS